MFIININRKINFIKILKYIKLQKVLKIIGHFQ